MYMWDKEALVVCVFFFSKFRVVYLAKIRILFFIIIIIITKW